MARKKSITNRRRALFLATLRETGAVTKAAKAGEINRSSWYDLAARDPDFLEEWDDAEAEYLDDVQAEAIDRGMNGVIKKLPYTEYKGDTKKTKFYSITMKSDKLLELCLKSRHPLYKPTKAVEVTSPDGSLKPGSHPELERLTDEELLTLAQIQRKLHASASGES